MAQISVIVPVYRVEDYLARCVESVLTQTFRDFELILVDDGSPDRCGILCDAYARQDSRVHVIHQENRGLSSARNAALDWLEKNSDSNWITFLDSDDWIHPKMLETMLKEVRTRRSPICLCAYGETDGEDPWNEPLLSAELWQPKALYMQRFANATIACAKLYHRACFQGVRFPVGKIHEDEFVTYRLLFAQKNIAVIPSPLYAYYRNEQSITKRNWTPRRLDAWEAYEQQIAFFESLSDRELVQFRYRGYLENAMVNLAEAEKYHDRKVAKSATHRIKRRIRDVIRRAWKCGAMDFRLDYDLLVQFYPIISKLYRFILEQKNK